MFEIKPLEWRQITLNRRPAYQADTIVGVLTSAEVDDGHFCAFFPDSIKNADSIDDAKAKAEAYYRERLMLALVPVKEEG